MVFKKHFNCFIFVVLFIAQGSVFTMGFENLTNTCNLNALLQMIVNTPALSNVLERTYDDAMAYATEYLESNPQFEGAVRRIEGISPALRQESILKSIALLHIMGRDASVFAEAGSAQRVSLRSCYFKPLLIFFESTGQKNREYRAKKKPHEKFQCLTEKSEVITGFLKNINCYVPFSPAMVQELPQWILKKIVGTLSKKNRIFFTRFILNNTVPEHPIILAQEHVGSMRGCFVAELTAIGFTLSRETAGRLTPECLEALATVLSARVSYDALVLVLQEVVANPTTIAEKNLKERVTIRDRGWLLSLANEYAAHEALTREEFFLTENFQQALQLLEIAEFSGILCKAMLVLNLGNCIKNYAQAGGAQAFIPLEVQEAVQLVAQKYKCLPKEIRDNLIRYGSYLDQHDADEVYKVLLDALMCPGLRCAQAVYNVTRCMVSSTLRLDCLHPKVPQHEAFPMLEVNPCDVKTVSELSAAVAQRTTLHDRLTTLFQEEQLDEAEWCMCDVCAIPRPTLKKLSLCPDAIPPVFSVQLKRKCFLEDVRRFVLAKRRVELPLLLDMSAHGYVGVTYMLKGVVCRLGDDPDGGHYVSYFQRGGRWFFANDGEVTAIEHFVANGSQPVAGKKKKPSGTTLNRMYLDNPTATMAFYQICTEAELAQIQASPVYETDAHIGVAQGSAAASSQSGVVSQSGTSSSDGVVDAGKDACVGNSKERVEQEGAQKKRTRELSQDDVKRTDTVENTGKEANGFEVKELPADSVSTKKTKIDHEESFNFKKSCVVS